MAWLSRRPIFFGASVPANKAKLLSSRIVFKGKVFSVRRDRLREPGGMTVTREVVAHHGSVVVLPVFADGSILLIRQYRHAVGGYLWELVAGHVEPGEQPKVAAGRELIEETGYVARHLRKLLEFFPSPGLLSERMSVYLATGLTPGVAQPEEDERILPRRFSLRAVENNIRRGQIRDGKSVAAILYYARFVR
jgi:ADP-ribose pyrophosphatase